MSDFLFLFPILVFLCLEGLFSGGEIALVACDINIMRKRAKAGSRSASVALKLMEKPEWFLSTTLTGTNLCAVSNTAITTAMFISMFGTERGELVSIVVMIPLILVVGEIIPKSIFQQHATLMAPKISWFIWIASWIFYPVVLILSKLSRRVVYVFSRKKDLAYSSYITKNGLESLLQEEKRGSDIMKSEKEMIQNIFDFSDATADQIMVPLSNVTLLPAKTTLKDAARVIAEKGYSHIPVYNDKVFDIIGILYSFDILESICRKDQSSLAPEEILIENCAKQNILYVPETKPAKELFFELQKRDEDIAVVVDEYGGATGIVTIEDILEEIVGEIEDESHSNGGGLYRKVGSGKYLFDAQAKIDNVRNLLPIDIPHGDYETLGGFLLYKMGKIPKRSDSFKFGPLLFIIEDADVKLIREVLVILPPDMNLLQ